MISQSDSYATFMNESIFDESSMFTENKTPFFKKSKSEHLRSIINEVGNSFGFYSFYFQPSEIYCVNLSQKTSWLFGGLEKTVYIIISTESSSKYEYGIQYYLSQFDDRNAKDFIEELKKQVAHQLNLIMVPREEKQVKISTDLLEVKMEQMN